MSNLKNAYALLIGIGNDLPVTVHDATAIHNILADEALAGYPQENIILITDKNATRKGILEAFDLLISKIDENSSVFLFYSGHGGLYEPWNQFYLVPNNFDPEEYETTWVKAEELKEKIQAINSKKLIFFLDCCHAAGMTKSSPTIGNTKNTPKIRLENADGLAQKIDDGKGMSIISSCREDQLSYIMDGDNNSLFTKCLIEVLKGKHKPEFKEPYVRISEVISHIFKSVPERNPEQKPYANLQIYDDFALSFLPDNMRNNIETSVDVEPLESSKEISVTTSYRDSQTAQNAVIFVHGFTGEAAETFGILPKLLIEDSNFDDWDLFPLGFSEFVNPALGKNIWASVDDIEKVADYLQTSIRYKYGRYQKIAIITHGLGGIVAQKAILELPKTHQNRISHMLLFASPNNGISSSFLSKLWNKHLSDFNQKGRFIKKIRKDWNESFSTEKPFVFKAIAATHDEYISTNSNLSPFKNSECGTIMGNHFSIVQPKDKSSDTCILVKEILLSKNSTNSVQFNEVQNEKKNQEEIARTLLPNVAQLDKRGLSRLIFALESLKRSDEAIEILTNHSLTQTNSDVLGIIGGRYKRKYIINYFKADGDKAIEYYTKGLQIAKDKEDYQQLYYIHINLAFLNLLVNDDEQVMRYHSKKAIMYCDLVTINTLWKQATLAEANVYLGKIELATKYYKEVLKKASRRQKISIYNNAFTGYVCLTKLDNQEDDFIKFLKTHFLN